MLPPLDSILGHRWELKLIRALPRDQYLTSNHMMARLILYMEILCQGEETQSSWMNNQTSTLHGGSSTKMGLIKIISKRYKKY